MTIHAYPEIYLNRAQIKLGDAFDYAINTCKIPGDEFIKLFTVSSISKRIENGEAAILAGMSGIEIAIETIRQTTKRTDYPEPPIRYERSVEYWIGWAIAYYQWYSGRKFYEIFKAISFEELSKVYYTLHEADISKFVDLMDRKIREIFPETNLKRLRSLCGYTRSQLAELSQVSLRSIQMYEQRKKNINKASAETLYLLSKALSCKMEDLIEKYPGFLQGLLHIHFFLHCQSREKQAN